MKARQPPSRSRVLPKSRAAGSLRIRRPSTGTVRGALDPASGLWGDTKGAGAKIRDRMIDGRAARSAKEMRGEFGDAVSRQGGEREELPEAILGGGALAAIGATAR